MLGQRERLAMQESLAFRVKDETYLLSVTQTAMTVERRACRASSISASEF